MSRLGFKSVVCHGDIYLGELDAIPFGNQNFQFPNNEIRIHHISSFSERCPPLSILQTIASFSIRCKLESSSPAEQPYLTSLHASCFHELKTAVVLLGEEEIHLVAMPSKQKKFPCFWCYSVPTGLYDSCLRMLNLRCLAIVFDLDETLIVANTMKSFEDRIEALNAWIARETDPMRISGMSAELKRYVDDRILLKQYIENDCVVDNGKVLKVQAEEVPPISDGHEKVVRPVIRVHERNMVLTRINPEIRDTSVLVRLRPAWEDLRSYLIAKGRKRFEVYVCTMAERDYALEMWRLLDPEAHLIATKQLVDRVVCVKSGSRKSLLDVFRDGMCHPKMAMVIDDRLKVWEDKDQPRVHVVPAFTPYYAPLAETANAVPVLCVARNVACNVRGYFFKEFDENLLRRISEVFYEDELVNLPPPPDVSNYLMTEDAVFVPNGTMHAPFSEGMNGVEVEQRLNQVDEKSVADSSMHSITSSSDLRSETSQLPATTISNVMGPASATALVSSQKPSLLGAPNRRDNNFSDAGRLLNPKPALDMRNQNLGQPPLLSRVPAQILSSSVPPQGGWLGEEETNRAVLNSRPSGFAGESDVPRFDKLQTHQSPFSHSTLGFISTGLLSHGSQLKSEEACAGHDLQKQNSPPLSQLAEAGISQSHMSLNSRENQTEGGKLNLPHLYIGALQEIGRRCSSKVEFRSVVSTSKDLQFSVEVLFTGEKIGVGKNSKQAKKAQISVSKVAPSVDTEFLQHEADFKEKTVAETIKVEPKLENTSLTSAENPPFQTCTIKDCGADWPVNQSSGMSSKSQSSLRKAEKGKLSGNLTTSSDPEFIDIDSNYKDPQLCGLYAPDIYTNLHVAELARRPYPRFMEKLQRDITQSMRGILIDWLVEVSEEYRLAADTLYLTVFLIDWFLSQNYIERQRLQLLGITCMLIASKYEEICAPRVEEFCFITDNTYTREEVLKMETRVLKFFGFQIYAPTSKTFLRRFLRAAQASYKSPCIELEFLANYLAELTLLDYEFLKFLPSIIAASAVFLARWTLDQSSHPWSPTLEHYTTYKASDLKTPVHALQGLQSNTTDSPLNAIRMKYTQEKFKSVAALSSQRLLDTLFYR